MNSDLNKYNTFVFDFDGVILDSNKVKEAAFQELFLSYGSKVVDNIGKFHRQNLGVHRHKKIAYFFERFCKISVSDELIREYSERFSHLTLSLLSDSKYLIHDSIGFIRKMKLLRERRLYVASAASEEDVLALCRIHNLHDFFDGIFGGPESKTQLICKIIQHSENGRCVMIGDSINDYNAAIKAGVDFYGYNNTELRGLGSGYVQKFSELSL